MSNASRGHNRPDPDALLTEVKQQDARRQRGQLKIFFGMSAGVGKTYAMLEEARKRAAEGVDVLVGYAEPHIRPDTEAMLVALDLLPYRLLEYRGATLKEFDLDAALARAPAICCVDELAHTNAAGMRHPKRWQDIVELLEAGISVFTTLNVQHLESVNDLVERITGVQVRETLPDAVFDAADEVELVDIAPDELLERFREGRIYKPEQAERASKHFFTKGNLIALRELALRRMADRVDEQVQQHRRDERRSGIVPASERVLVCVGPSPLSARLVRSAHRLAAGMRAKLIAVSVQPPGVGARTLHDRPQLDANLRLAETLGAAVVTLSGRSVGGEVLAYAATHNVTKIVVGKPDRSRLREFLFGSVVDDLIRGSGDIDVYVIRGEPEASAQRTRPAVRQSARAFDWAGTSIALVIVAITTAIGWPLYHRLHVANENVLMLYLLGVLWVAARRSRGAAVLASLFAVAAFDLTFVDPVGRLTVSDRQYGVTLVVMLLTALVISALTHRVRELAEAARLRERRTAAVLQLSRDLSVARSAADVARATARHVADAVGGRTAILLPQAAAGLQFAFGSEADGPLLDPNEMVVAQWAAEHAEPAGRGTGTLPASAGRYVPLMDAGGSVGVLAIYPSAGQQDWTAEQRDLVQAMSMQAAVAMSRVLLGEEAREAWEHVEAESLRNTLLSGVSHDLRTPLAGIIGSATTLSRSIGTGEGTATHRELLDTIVDESERMDRLINNLLDMSRLESGAPALKREWTPLDDVVGGALRATERRLGHRPVNVALPAELPLVNVDVAAIEQVLINLIDNAIEHTPAGTAIELGASGAEDHVTLWVSDHGPGLPPGAQRRVFDKFYRVASSGPQTRSGVGLGLAICRALVAAHGGMIEALNRIEGGATFRFTIPSREPPPVIDSSG